MIYLQLFWEFFKTGLFSVGGGLATIPFLYDMAARYDWFTAEELANMLAVSESTPGPIGVNMATFAGMNAAGVPGGVIVADLRALVRGTVVHQQQLKIGIGLTENAVHAFFQVLLHLVNRYDHADHFSVFLSLSGLRG